MDVDLPSNKNLRSVTPDEIAHLHQFGWVKLERFIPRETIDEVLALAKDKMGENGDRDAPPASFAYFNSRTMRGLSHPVLAPVVRHCGRNAARLMARKAGVGARYFTDYYNVKLPSRAGRDFIPAMNVILKGRGAWRANGLSRLGIVSVHQGHSFEVEFSTDTSATGIWSMTDRLYFPPGGEFSYMTGFGHYHDAYEKIDNQWKLTATHITRLRVKVA
jgi:SnoaL-like domain